MSSGFQEAHCMRGGREHAVKGRTWRTAAFRVTALAAGLKGVLRPQKIQFPQDRGRSSVIRVRTCGRRARAAAFSLCVRALQRVVHAGYVDCAHVRHFRLYLEWALRTGKCEG